MGYARTRQLTALSLIFLPWLLQAADETANNPAQDSEAAALPVVKLSPGLREQDRDRDYYRSLDCRQLAHADARSDREQQWLAERKSACLDRYRAFSPRSFQQ